MSALLQDWVLQRAMERPQAAAIVAGSERISYAALEEASNRLARTLLDAGCRKGDRVCFLMPKSPAALIVMLGVLKTGAMHVPLDPNSPATRLRRIVTSAEPTLIMGAGPVAPLLDEILSGEKDVAVGWMDATAPRAEEFQPCFTRTDIDRASAAPLPRVGTSEDPAHLLFTSGSTGIPKGVIITHANVIAFVEWAVRHFGVEPGERFSGHTPLHFDLSTYDIFGAFASGAELHFIPPELALLPHKLAAFVREAQLTQWFSVPGVLTHMAKSGVLLQDDFPSLRRVMWCGEVLPTPILIHWMERLPHARFSNLYGPTEATIASSYYDVPACPAAPDAAVPIGTACDGEELLVLDEKRGTAPDGTIGDLYIRGAGLSPGYWRDPEKTAAAFLPNPAREGDRIYRTGDLAHRGADGLIYFVGRADTQIKSRGYRIELGEIETALNSLNDLREVAVVAIQAGGFEGSMICCAYAPAAESQDVTPVALRKAIARLVPSYMLPHRWMRCDSLPRNANGKIDRPALRERFLEQSSAGNSTVTA
jgi:amino acid adenylation domain-containing protein